MGCTVHKGAGEPAVEHLGSLAEVGLKVGGKCTGGALDAIGHLMQDLCNGGKSKFAVEDVVNLKDGICND